MPLSILIIYYSQTGQLRSILDHLLLAHGANCQIDIIEIKPVKPFPFPWKAYDFFDCMPESVLQIPEAIEPIQYPKDHYDLVILGYQPWFLSPSIPFNSYLQSEYAGFLKNKNILTVVGSRNMWLNAQERTKARLIELGAFLKGNIVLFDRNPNLISILSIIRWSFYGKKEGSRLLPEAGIGYRDIENSKKFGQVIIDSLQKNKLNDLQSMLLRENGIELKPSLIILEKRAIKNFRKFAAYIYQKGGRSHRARKSRVQLFSRLLFVGVFILSPLSSITAMISTFIHHKTLREEADYFKNVSYQEKAI